MSAKTSGPAVPFPITEDAVPFWEGCEAHELRVQRCASCGTWQFYPRYLCSTCGSLDVVFQLASGRATLWSYSVVERAIGEFADRVPYVVALARLAEGPVLMTNIVGCDPGSLTLDMPLMVRFERRLGRTVPVFAPASAATDVGSRTQ